ncbi:MAG TPA: hypothetical protein VLU43_00970 [Anaeromyxobacteraceae bacterium]|nr:hypothetical protein [Anaeromyxobacteraceae bacterium]
MIPDRKKIRRVLDALLEDEHARARWADDGHGGRYDCDVTRRAQDGSVLGQELKVETELLEWLVTQGYVAIDGPLRDPAYRPIRPGARPPGDLES